MEERISAWHFLPDDGKTANKNRRKVEVGKTYSCKGDIELCSNGMHGSRRLVDALGHAPGSIVCKVEIWGDVEEQDDKLCGRHRKVLAMADATRLLHEFACDVAEDALRKAGVTYKRSWNAIKTKRLWLDGKATDKELYAAWAAMRAAAWAAPWDVAWTAVSAAVRDAPWDAARAAVRAVASAAVRAAVSDAARDAAWDVARDDQNTMLTERVEKLLEGKDV